MRTSSSTKRTPCPPNGQTANKARSARQITRRKDAAGSTNRIAAVNLVAGGVFSLPLVIGIEFWTTLGIQSWTTGPRAERCYLPFLGSLSFLVFIDSRKR